MYDNFDLLFFQAVYSFVVFQVQSDFRRLPFWAVHFPLNLSPAKTSACNTTLRQYSQAMQQEPFFSTNLTKQEQTSEEIITNFLCENLMTTMSDFVLPPQKSTLITADLKKNRRFLTAPQFVFFSSQEVDVVHQDGLAKKKGVQLLMAEILHQFIGSLSHYL